jgi:hypothetical protein
VSTIRRKKRERICGLYSDIPPGRTYAPLSGIEVGRKYGPGGALPGGITAGIGRAEPCNVIYCY